MTDNKEISPISDSVSSMYKIRPQDIKISDIGTVPGSFGKAEVEISAGRLVQFFQGRGYWCSFTIEELARYYTLRGWDPNSMFFGLAGVWYDDGIIDSWRNSDPCIAITGSGKCFVTAEFIDKCADKKE